MADIELVIKIPKEDYIYIAKKHCLPSCDDRTLRKNVYEMIRKGTPLPKGHGRIGDLDALEVLCTEHEIGNSAFDNIPIIEQGYNSGNDVIWKPLFSLATTIIEADKAESEE